MNLELLKEIDNPLLERKRISYTLDYEDKTPSNKEILKSLAKSENVDEQGMVLDFKDIKETTNNLINKYDHKYLNELDEFSATNPTTENISKLLYHELSKDLPEDVFVAKVTTWESEGFGASYYK